MGWTKDQQKVINARDCSILVSAAAGSGKTAVLVERIIKLITDKENPVDVDRLLVVTFTKAAATEMKERIIIALEKAIEEDPFNDHLQRQITLINNAKITTIDSFCYFVVNNYFHYINLDPDFKIADETEVKLLKEDAVSNVLEEYYKNKNEDFIEFVEAFATGKSDNNLKEKIVKMFDFAGSHINPLKWLDECLNAYDFESFEDFKKSDTLKECFNYFQKRLSEAKRYNKMAKKVCERDDGPKYYLEALEDDSDFYESLEKSKDISDFLQKIEKIDYKTLSRKKAPNQSEEAKNLAKAFRDASKKAINDKIKKDYCNHSLIEYYEYEKKCKNYAKVLINLVKDFTKEFSNLKAARNLLDYNDIEHFALNILLDKENNPTPCALELRGAFYEILIDEYQDSNEVQDSLLHSISTEDEGKNNVFMVGDVKQSIYRFRMSKPDLFMEKYNSYSLEEAPFRRIDLKMNFRSRKEVLNSINFFFEQIMHKEVGNVEYDKNSALYVGNADYKECKAGNNTTEIWLINNDENFLQDNEIYKDNNEIEALAIAKRIKEMVEGENPLIVTDKITKELRPARYKDFAVLYRSINSIGELVLTTFLNAGVPAKLDTSTGYFNAYEVKLLLSLLSVIDNVRQDIPLCATMSSPMGDFTEKELAIIRLAYKDESFFYQAVLKVAGRQFDYKIPDEKAKETNAVENEEVLEDKEFIEFEKGDRLLNQVINLEKTPDKEISKEDILQKELEALGGIIGENDWLLLKEKVKKFLEKIEDYSRAATFMRVNELINYILDDSGFLNIIQAMPSGNLRVLNVKMLIQKAVEYEKTSYKGLFNFNRYIEKLQKYEIDFGEADSGGKKDDNVKIISIHKSKGLEFPVVIVANLGKKFNKMNTRDSILLHDKKGLAMNYVDTKNRIKYKTLSYKNLSNKIQEEDYGEELRVLYVALTRAKEKLILSIFNKDMDKYISKHKDAVLNDKKAFLDHEILNAASMGDWLIRAAFRHPTAKAYLLKHGEEVEGYPYEFDENDSCDLKFTDIFIYDIFAENMEESIEKMDKYAHFKKLDFNMDYGYKDMFKEKINYLYPFKNMITMKSKFSVSEIKKAHMVDEEGEEIFKEEVPLPYIPDFVEKKGENIGAIRGNAYHRILELLDFSKVCDKESISAQIKTMIENNLLEEEESKLVRLDDLITLFESDLGGRMIKAFERGDLVKENPFVMGKPASQINPDCEEDEIVLIQGIIDVFLYENDEIVLIDYKTDNVRSPKELVDRYTTQMDLYKTALENVTGKNVKECILYSFKLNNAIKL
ncbi:DNA helicase/exodeoxyribonuclease V, subunit A [Acetitomaculum ruminis DSM 5522]|uniref:ATP-dependent helicase/nuclease subunit A n=1 Tax=Acetitomaculum ruminis DSM 5522 TaxID=1120918 RepID=A0A1I0ZRE6_9FIRM|nr:UvrD-helicase domain-containing protein [Acetitomaculum ruminis]SFB28071.1 DNA helicase/exodeoxyribonuclease V, subunit A [Acetitomaculum ruminis DSM 5522]